MSSFVATWKQVVAFGDSINDYPVFEKAERSVLIGENCHKFSLISTYQVPDFKHEGLICALEKFKLLKTEYVMNKTLNLVFSYLQSIDCIRGLFIVGSYARGICNHDVDLLLIADDSIDKYDFSRKLSLHLDAVNVFANDDSIACRISGFDFDFALLTMKSLFQRVDSISKGTFFAEHRNWCIGYWMPEGFIYDLKNSELVFCKDESIAKCINCLLSKQNMIRKRLIDDVKREILLKSRLRNDGSYYDSIARSDVLMAFLRLLNLTGNWELTSFKHITERLKDSDYSKMLEQLENASDDVFEGICKQILSEHF